MSGNEALPIFEELLAQLQMRHQLDLQTLKGEANACRARAERSGPLDEASASTTATFPAHAHQPQLSHSAPCAHRTGTPKESSAVNDTRLCVKPRKSAGCGAREPQGPVAEDASRFHRASSRTSSSSPVPEEMHFLNRGNTASPTAHLTDDSNLKTRRQSTASRIFADVAPGPINFHTLCMQAFPDRSWYELSTHEKVSLIREALKPRHILINPHSSAMQAWDALLALALVFVGIAMPYEAVFVTRVNWLFFGVGRLVDALFVLDICLQFFLQVEVARPHRGGSVLLSSPAQLRRRYLRSWFCIDVLSVLPFELLSALLASSSSKVIRYIKLLELSKLLRARRARHTLQRWRSTVSIRISTQRLVWFFMVVLLVCHWMACIWGFAGLTLGAELCDKEGQLSTVGLTSPAIDEVSWLTVLFLGGKTSPDHPCNHFEVYIASLHWAVMTLTSIGYGDIVPVRLEEYIVGICCMLVGGVLWAYVIGCVCTLISNTSRVEQMFEINTDLLNRAMGEACVPRGERSKFREYLREAKAHDRRTSVAEVAERFSPKLRSRLMYHLMKEPLHSVYYFKGEAPGTFLTDVASSLRPMFFAERESLDHVQDCLCLMDRGTVMHDSAVLVYPCVFHEDFIISDKRFRRTGHTHSLTYVQILVLTSEDMRRILSSYPGYAKVIYRYALKAAFCRAVRMAMVVHKEWLARKSEDLPLDRAFDLAFVQGDAGGGGVWSSGSRGSPKTSRWTGRSTSPSSRGDAGGSGAWSVPNEAERGRVGSSRWAGAKKARDAVR